MNESRDSDAKRKTRADSPSAPRRAPNLALDLSSEHIVLREQHGPDAAKHWREIGRAELAADDFRDQVERLRIESLARTRKPLPIELWLPQEQISEAWVRIDARDPAERRNRAADYFEATTNLGRDEIELAVMPVQRDMTRRKCQSRPNLCLAFLNETRDEAIAYASRWGFVPGAVTTGLYRDLFEGSPDFARADTAGERLVRRLGLGLRLGVGATVATGAAAAAVWATIAVLQGGAPFAPFSGQPDLQAEAELPATNAEKAELSFASLQTTPEPDNGFFSTEPAHGPASVLAEPPQEADGGGFADLLPTALSDLESSDGEAPVVLADVGRIGPGARHSGRASGGAALSIVPREDEVEAVFLDHDPGVPGDIAAPGTATAERDLPVALAAAIPGALAARPDGHGSPDLLTGLSDLAGPAGLEEVRAFLAALRLPEADLAEPAQAWVTLAPPAPTTSAEDLAHGDIRPGFAAPSRGLLSAYRQAPPLGWERAVLDPATPLAATDRRDAEIAALDPAAVSDALTSDATDGTDTPVTDAEPATVEAVADTDATELAPETLATLPPARPIADAPAETALPETEIAALTVESPSDDISEDPATASAPAAVPLPPAPQRPEITADASEEVSDEAEPDETVAQGTALTPNGTLASEAGRLNAGADTPDLTAKEEGLAYALATAPQPRHKPKVSAPTRLAALNRGAGELDLSPRRGTTLLSVGKAATETGLKLNQTSLIGIINLDAGRQALLRMPNGRFRRVARGDVLDGWQVNVIGRDALRLTRAGKQHTLLLVGR